MDETLSKIPIKITLVGQGEAMGVLDRLTAPLTVEEIVGKLPIKTRITPAMGFVNVLLGIKRGAEKPVSSVKAGTIAYWPRGDSLCIYPRDTKPYGQVNRLGVVTENLELFNKVRSGTRITIEKV